MDYPSLPGSPPSLSRPSSPGRTPPPPAWPSPHPLYDQLLTHFQRNLDLLALGLVFLLLLTSLFVPLFTATRYTDATRLTSASVTITPLTLCTVGQCHSPSTASLTPLLSPTLFLTTRALLLLALPLLLLTLPLLSLTRIPHPPHPPPSPLRYLTSLTLTLCTSAVCLALPPLLWALRGSVRGWTEERWQAPWEWQWEVGYLVVQGAGVLAMVAPVMAAVHWVEWRKQRRGGKQVAGIHMPAESAVEMGLAEAG